MTTATPLALPRFSTDIPCRTDADAWSDVRRIDEAREAQELCLTRCPVADFDRCQAYTRDRIASGERIASEVLAGVWYPERPHTAWPKPPPPRDRQTTPADVEAWVADRCTLGGAESSPVLHVDFTAWCKPRGIRATSACRFATLLTRIGYGTVGYRRNPLTGSKVTCRPLTLRAGAAA